MDFQREPNEETRPIPELSFFNQIIESSARDSAGSTQISKRSAKKFYGGIKMLRRFLRIIASSLLLSIIVSSPVWSAKGLESGIDDLVGQIIKSMQEKALAKIAIMEFVKLDGSVDNFCRYLSERLITNMFLTGKFEVVERTQLNKAVEELKMSQSELVDPQSVKRLGKHLGADSLTIGSVADLGDVVEVNARLVATETGKIFAVASTQFQKDDRVARLMGAEPVIPSKEKTVEEKLLGIEVRGLTPDLRRKYNLEEDEKGVVVTEVKENSPAVQVGLSPGDMIKEVNQHPIKDLDDFKAAMQKVEPGGVVLLRVRHGVWTMFVTLPTRR